MSLPFTKEQLAPIMFSLEIIKKKPSILHSADLAFVKSFIEHFGGKVPCTDAPSEEEPKMAKSPDNQNEESEPESEESDLELDMTGVIEPDTDSPQEMGDSTVEPTEEQIEESQAKRSAAVSAFVEKDYTKAIELYTEAIVLNPQAALLYAKRGQIYLLNGKPNACIRDCDRALELNPDNAAAHKFRGRSYQLLGRFEEAAVDLRLACKFDFDEQTDEWLREATPNARKIDEHKRKRERKSIEKAARKRLSAAKKAEATPEASENEANASHTKESAKPEGNFIGQFHDLLKQFQDPEELKAFMDMSINPKNASKYADNPKLMDLLNKTRNNFKAEASSPVPDDDILLD